MVFTINGSDVSAAAVRRVADLKGDNPIVASVYAAFTDLNAYVPLRRLTITGNAVQATCAIARSDGGTWTQTILLNGGALDPGLSLIYSAGWRYSEVVRSRPLVDALVALAATAKVGTLILEP